MTKKNTTQTADSVAQIRDILFGEQVKIIESRFEQLEKSLNLSIEQLSKKIDTVNKDLGTTITQVNQELGKKIEQSNNQLQTESLSLAQENAENIKKLEQAINNKIIETESDLLNQIQTGLQKLDNKASHRNELAQLLQEMASKLAD